MEATRHQYSPTEVSRLRDWIAKWIGASWVWHARFLSGTETSATQAQRSGPCVPRDLLKPAFPSLAEDSGPPGVEFDIAIDSHGVREDRVRAVPHIGQGLFGAPLRGPGPKVSSFRRPEVSDSRRPLTPYHSPSVSSVGINRATSQ